jgi:hypothetical protein
MTILSKFLSLMIAVTLVQCSFNMNTDQVDGEGPVVTKNIDISGFTEIDVSNGWNVQLIPNQPPQLVVKTNENLVDLLEVNESGDKLSISAEDNIGSADSKLIKVYFDKKLTLIKASSASDLTAKEELVFESTTIDASSDADISLSIKADILEVEGSSGSDITLDAASNDLSVEASSSADISIKGDNKSITAKASSRSDIELEGISEKADFEATSGSDIDARDLEAKNVIAEASSGANIDCYPLDTLEATASSGADIKYHNNPSKNVASKSTSGGSVSKD